MPIALVYRGRLPGELDDLDARTLIEELQAPRSAAAAVEITSKVRAAVKASTEGETGQVSIDDPEQLGVLDQVCVESRDIQRLRNFGPLR